MKPTRERDTGSLKNKAPQWLKPLDTTLNGAAEAVPFQSNGIVVSKQ
jgi:hypothetical protein